MVLEVVNCSGEGGGGFSRGSLQPVVTVLEYPIYNRSL